MPTDDHAGAPDIRIGGRRPKAAGGALAGTAGGAKTADAGDGALWALSSPKIMARTARHHFGRQAATAASRCAVSALFRGRDGDFRFWLAVFDLLDTPPPADRTPSH